MAEDISSQLVIYDGSNAVVPYNIQDDILFNKVRLLRTNPSNYIQTPLSIDFGEFTEVNDNNTNASVA